MRDLVCAVDVGSGSARAGIFDLGGRTLGRASREIALRNPGPDRAEHDSEDIWAGVCGAVRAALDVAGATGGQIAAIAFDATCSIVVRGATGGISVAEDAAPGWDTIAWSDHRALREAVDCTATGHAALDRLGGSMSPEMQIPKLMWLKRNLPGSWAAATGIFDLADYLTWRATGDAARSHCTLVCKWSYMPDAGGWQSDLLDAVGLDDLLVRGGLRQDVRSVGQPVGALAADAADALGLDAGCVVASGLIDAFAGAIGVLGGLPEAEIGDAAALIAGTSTCVMSLSPTPRHVQGVWGPYRDVVLPGYWAIEGGQSASGALLDHMIRQFGLEPTAEVHERIARSIADRGADFASGLHILPDFKGNRTPAANARARGVISGLELDGSFEGLCRLYWRTAVALALGVRQIVRHLDASGVTIGVLHIAGGHAGNRVLAQLYADASGLPVTRATEGDAVLLGAAIAAAAAAGRHSGLRAAAAAMRPPVETLRPDTGRMARYETDYRVFLRMQEHEREIRALASAPDGPE